jgi:hypothetical protein
MADLEIAIAVNPDPNRNVMIFEDLLDLADCSIEVFDVIAHLGNYDVVL